MTLLPTPMFPGQSPGRGDIMRPGGGGGGIGFLDSADEEPQALSVVPIPMAAIVRSIAEPPTARPTEARKSRLAMRVVRSFMCFTPLYLLLYQYGS